MWGAGKKGLGRLKKRLVDTDLSLPYILVTSVICRFMDTAIDRSNRVASVCCALV